MPLLDQRLKGGGDKIRCMQHWQLVCVVQMRTFVDVLMSKMEVICNSLLFLTCQRPLDHQIPQVGLEKSCLSRQYLKAENIKTWHVGAGSSFNFTCFMLVKIVEDAEVR